MLKALRKWIKDPRLSLSYQSWADIFIVQMITNRKVQCIIFMKFVLIYVPVIEFVGGHFDMLLSQRYSKIS